MSKLTRTSVSIPEDLYKKIQESATKDRRSVAAQIIVLIERGLESSTLKDTEQ